MMSATMVLERKPMASSFAISVVLHAFLLVLLFLYLREQPSVKPIEIDLSMPMRALPKERPLVAARATEALRTAQGGPSSTRLKSLLNSLQKSSSSAGAKAPTPGTGSGLDKISERLRAQAMQQKSVAGVKGLQSLGVGKIVASGSAQVSAGGAPLTPAVEKEILAAIQRHEAELARCYESSQLVDPEIMGTAALVLVSGGSGSVGRVESSFSGRGQERAKSTLGACLKTKLQRVRLPATIAAGQQIQFSYLFRN